jgi:predicted nucleic acid-binding protein
MPRALVDTTVLFAATYRCDSAHDDALPILRGIDTADLPEAVILDDELAETLDRLNV